MGNMLQDLPFDAMANIVSGFQLEDVIHLSRTCRQMRSVLSEPTLCRKAVESTIRHTSEAQLAVQGKIQWRAALLRVYARREAFATGSPVSVLALGYCTSALYMNGVLCYVTSQTMRILDVHGQASEELVLYLPYLLQEAIGTVANAGRWTLLHYSHGLLVCQFHTDAPPMQSYLLAVSVGSLSQVPPLLRYCHPIPTSTRLFACNDANFVYFGVHAPRCVGGQSQWMISGIDVATGQIMGEIFLDFQMGMDVGSTICFAIYGPHFYALSNQTAYLAEEISWKSNYQCVRFPLESPKQELVEKQADIWRRCHQEGPINDSWTDLNLKVDERTGELVIVEARREWSSGTSKDASNSKKRGASGAKRTYYMQPLHFQGQVERAASSSAAVSSFDGQQSGGSCPLDPESLIGDVSPLDRSHYCNASLRLPRHVHLGDDGTAETSPSFILFRTKCRFYSPSCQAYLDLVDDAENLPPEDDQVLWQRLRLRVGSRQRAPPAFTTEGLLAPRRLHRETRELIPGSEEVYRRRPGGVKLWPPPRPRPGAPRNPELDKLEALLNPIKFPAGTGHVVGMADERSLLYLTGPPATGATAATSSKAMVLVSFDNWIGPSGRAWARYMMGPASPSPCSQTLSRELLPPTSTRRRTPTSPTTAEMSPHLTNALLGRPHEAGASWSSSNWAAREPAMYRFLDGGRWLQRNVRAALRSCEQEAGEDFGTE